MSCQRPVLGTDVQEILNQNADRMNKKKLREYISENRPKTALDYLGLISEKYEKHAELKDYVILQMAHWSRLTNEAAKLVAVPSTELSKLNSAVLELINQLSDEEFDVKLPDSPQKIAETLEYGSKGKKNHRWAILSTRWAIISTIAAVVLALMGTLNTLDRKRLAFEYLFSDISKNNSQKNFQSLSYKGDWFLEHPYIIRKDTIQGEDKVYYTVGESAKAYFYCIDSLNLGGIEYITNLIYSVSVTDTVKIKVFKDLDSIGKKIQTLNIVFREEINIDGKKTDAERRTGSIMGRYFPDNDLTYFFAQQKHKNIIKNIIKKYESASKRKCTLKIEIDDEDEKKKFICTCETVEKNPSKYVKILKQK